MAIKDKTKESNLVGQCLKNNRQAQKKLYDQYKDAMYTLAYRITARHQDAEDVLQETFIQVFLNLSSFRGKSSLGAWIKTILIRNAIRQTKIHINHQELNEINQKGRSFSIDENLTGHYIENAILKLDPGYRAVFIMAEIEGFKHREISQILGISVGTSKSQLYHAKNQLRKTLESVYY
jgi:RNA polymerase sigma-70 factor (ECF subfamily)